jgi:hypothetical protein
MSAPPFPDDPFYDPTIETLEIDVPDVDDQVTVEDDERSILGENKAVRPLTFEERQSERYTRTLTREVEKAERVRDRRTRQAGGLLETPVLESEGVLAPQDPLYSPLLDTDAGAMTTLPATKSIPDETGAVPVIRNTVNFLFGEDMAILGVKWDEEGFRYGADIMKHQWSESPVMSSIAAAGLAASVVFPIAGAVRKSARIGSIAKASARRGEFVSQQQKLENVISGKPEGGLGLLKFDNHTEQVRHMSREIDELGQPRYFNQEMAEKLQTASPTELRKMVSKRDVDKLLLAEDHRERFIRLERKVAEDRATHWDLGRLQLNKMFSNTYFNKRNELSRDYIEKLDDYYSRAGIGKFLLAVPDPEHGKNVFRHLYNDLSEEEFARLPESVRNWTTMYKDDAIKLQAKMLEEGFITPETAERIGALHVPALKTGTPDTEEFVDRTTRFLVSELGETTAVKTKPMPKLGAPSLLQRKRTREQILGDVDNLITDPKDLMMVGLVRDHQLLHTYGFMRDMVINSGNARHRLGQFIRQAEDIERLSPAARRQWVSLDDIKIPGAADRIRRMVEKKVGSPTGALPYMHTRVFDEFFGETGVLGQVTTTAGLMQVMTAIHKTSRTGLNPATHVQNLAGNMLGFLPMAGFNPFTVAALNDGRVLSRGFVNIARQTTTGEKNISHVMNKDNLTKIFGKDNIVKTEWGQLDLAEEFSNPLVRQILEESAFEQVEGLNHTKQMFKRLSAMDNLEDISSGGPVTKGASRFAARKVAEVFSKFAEKKGVKQGLHAASSAYLGEDMVPKMMYYLNLRKKGWSIDAATNEVGRRLPQYATVGSSIQGMRKVFLPWITFPAETARIMKNNMMDFPLRMLPWLHLPGITQSMASGLGLGPASATEVGRAKEAVPAWASKPSSVLLEGGGKAGAALGTGTGVTVGAMVGAAMGGAKGAALGAGVGGAALGATGYMGTKNEEHIRSWLMDFLPYSALMPATTAREAEPKTARQILDLSPLEPFAVLTPLLDLTMGEGSFGRQLPVNGINEAVSKASLGLLGFLSPSLLQKYGMKLTKPDGSFIPMSKITDGSVEDIEISGLPGAIAGGVAGGLFGASGGIGAAVTGAGLGALAGSEINTKRIAVDLGIEKSHYNMQEGNPVYDLLFTSMLGAPKSWKADPVQLLFNDQLRQNKFGKIRTSLARELRDHIMNGREAEANLVMQSMFNTFTSQYMNIPKAQREFINYMDRRIREITKLPALRGMSEESLRERLLEAGEFALDARSKQAQALVDAIRNELFVRRTMNPKGGAGSYLAPTRKSGRKKPKRRKRKGIYD